MSDLNYKVLITTSGVGQRLGEFTKYTNKSLVRIGKKPALSYIIEAYPESVPLVITTGYYGQHVKDFVKLAYPNRLVEFVDVDKYEGEGSSLGYSMLQAKDKLQTPFIFHASDTIIGEEIPAPDRNWIGGFKDGDPSQYGSWVMDKGKPAYNDKGAIEFDFLHIGLVGVQDFQKFWDALSELYKNKSKDPLLNDTQTISQMIERGANFEIKPFTKWFDVSNVVAFHKAKESLDDFSEIYDKVDESLFIFNDEFVIKFFHNVDIVTNRVKRAKILEGLVPEIQASSANFYKYKYVNGHLFSKVVNPREFKKFLKWAKDNLWKESSGVSKEEFKKVCLDFYKTKTLARIGKFYEQNLIKDNEHIINGEKVPKLQEMLELIDWDWLTDAKPHRMHGDFILDNTLKTAEGYTLLDWRQDFGGILEVGDIYYDLAKMNHNLIIERDIINKNLFLIKVEGVNVTCDIMRKQNLVECQEILIEFLKKENLDVKKTKVLTAIVLLNMAPLHHHPFNMFLYYYGKLYLWKALN